MMQTYIASLNLDAVLLTQIHTAENNRAELDGYVRDNIAFKTDGKYWAL